MKFIIGALVIGVVVALVLLIKNKIQHGSSCCGEHEAMADKVKAADTNPKHYSYHYKLIVNGMVCAKCIRRVENTFHETGEMLASVDLGKKEVSLHSMRELSRQETAKMLDGAGYTLMEFEQT